ncbi:hypothetical protein [Lutibacter sp.]|uniref:hypothetical protein n=1 Tax=Lutibacter sp. TaxID=1925666 RepID=UPI0035646E19
MEGNKRELHTELAVGALNFIDKIDAEINYSKEVNILNIVVSCPYFKTNFIPVVNKTVLDYSQIDSFVIFMCVEVSAEISIFDNSEIIKTGETILIPAIANTVIIISENCKLLEVTV